MTLARTGCTLRAIIRGFERVRKRDYSTWDMLLWTHDLTYIRRSPAFQHYLGDNGILAYWQRHGYPTQRRPQGAGTVCE